MNKSKIINNTPRDLPKPLNWRDNQFNDFSDLMIILHHTVGGTMQQIDKSHAQRFTKLGQELGKLSWTGQLAPFPNISYHYIITSLGVIFQNRDINQVGFHSANAYTNNRAIAISFGGNYENEELDDKQLRALATILREIYEKYSNNGTKPLKIFGHFQVGDTPTACPGKNVKKYIKKINKLANLKQWNNFTTEYLKKMDEPSEPITLLNNGKPTKMNNTTNKPTKLAGFYESVFHDEFGGKSSIISDIPQALKRLAKTEQDREQMFFLLIALERLSNRTK